MKEDLGIESIWEGHCGEENMEKECQQENICTKKSGKLCSKDLNGCSALFSGYSYAGEKSKIQWTKLSLWTSARKMLTLTY